MLTGIGTSGVMDLSTYFDESSWVVSPPLTSNSVVEIRNLLSSANVVFIGISQLVRLSVNRIRQKKITPPIFTKFSGKVARGPIRKKRLDFRW